MGFSHAAADVSWRRGADHPGDRQTGPESLPDLHRDVLLQRGTSTNISRRLHVQKASLHTFVSQPLSEGTQLKSICSSLLFTQ